MHDQVSGPDESQPDLRDAKVPPRHPFDRLRAAWLLPAVLVGAAVAGITLTAELPRAGLPSDERFVGFVSYLGALAVMVVAAWVVRIDWRRLMGPVPSRATLPLAVVVVPIALFTVAAALAVYVPLSYAAPAFVTRHFLAPDSFTSVRSLGQWFLLLLAGVVAAPVVEEVLFRGLLLHRWSHRWGTTTGVVASSALFAVLHEEWIGHFLFGVAMCALYMRTRSLWIPIAAHALNNGMALVGTLPNALSHHAEAAESMAEFRGGAWTIAPLLAGALVTLWLYLQRYWPGTTLRDVLRGRVPYEG